MNNILLKHPSIFRLDLLGGFTAAAIVVFTILILSYSIKFMRGRAGLLLYYLCILLSAIASIGVVLANNIILLLACWGFLGLLLYLLINMGEDATSVAKKTLIIVGGSDAIMLLGLGVIYYLSGSMRLDQIRLTLNSGYSILAFVCIAIACFAKAGAMPFHGWIPETAKHAPLPAVAYLPASLDKLLGIYLLARLSLELFVMNNAIGTMLMLVGAITIVIAVLMALSQHNAKRLLGYHAVSQVGYMILGIGTGNPIGIAGGLFHMLNNAVYKSCLFLSAGNVEYRAKTSELDELGGLSRLMPITYITFLIASLSISGVPPFNGFVSKWLIYQGLIARVTDSHSLLQTGMTVFCLLAAMFGSALTLASFMKLIHAIFLGPASKNSDRLSSVKEVSSFMWLPCVVLAVVCVLFGVFAFVLPLKYFIFPVVSGYQSINASVLLGDWWPVAASAVVLISLLIGFIFFKIMRPGFSAREDIPFVGGENANLANDDAVTGVDFYNSLEEVGFVRGIYKLAKKGVFDIYEQAKRILSFSRFLQYLHNGVLPTYLVWVLLGMLGLLVLLVR